VLPYMPSRDKEGSKCICLSIHGWSIASASLCMHAYIIMNHIDATIDITHRIVPGTRVVGMLVVGTVIS